MAYILRYMSKEDDWKWSGTPAVIAGESYTVIQHTNAASSTDLVNHLRKIGREVRSSSSISTGGLEVGEIKKTNNWIVERIE